MENKHTIYLNMCHHYRKIFNAKSCVDTSPPKVLWKKTNQVNHRGTSPLHTKTVSKNTSATTPETTFKKTGGPVICPFFYQHHHLKNVERNCAENKSFMVSKKSFSPTVLKSDAQSMIRNLHYHPPRKKRIALNNSKVSKSSQSITGNHQTEEKLQDHCFPKPDRKTSKLSTFPTFENSYSEESSEDSAYNEGECILSSDSRGSTPQISTVKNQLLKRSLGATNHKIIRKISSSQSNTKDDIVCIQFLKEITSDILKKNIFTNKALRMVFQQHVALNKYQLDADKMLKEITKLQERLGVPLDDQFDDEDYGLGKDLPNTEILEEIEEVVDKPVIRTESPIADSHSKNEIHSESSKSQHEAEEYEENYSDSFSDISRSDGEKSENDNNSDSEEVATASKELHDNSNNSDGGRNYRKSASNSEVDSDLEISEAC